MDAVRTAEHAFAPRAQQIAFGIEYRNRMLAAIEGINSILPVDPDCGAVAERNFFRYLRPVLMELRL